MFWKRRVLQAAAAVGVVLSANSAAVAQEAAGFDFGTPAAGPTASGTGGFDFGSSSVPQTSSIPESVKSSDAYAKYTQAQGMIEGRQYLQAAEILNGVISAGDNDSFTLAPQLHYEIGRALYEAGFYQSALNHFDMVVQQGPKSAEFDLTLPYLVQIGRALPGEPNRFSRIYENYLNKFPTEVPPNLVPELGYVLGMAAYRESKLDDVIFFVGHVADSSDFYPKSRYLEGVTYVRQNKGQPALDSFKEVLRWLDAKARERQLTPDELRLRDFAIAALGRVFYQVGSTLWKTGDREKAIHSWNTAIKYYNAFGRDSGDMWLESLFEASWAYYRLDNFGKALGHLLTLNSPFFNDKYYPEAMLLQATIYYTNCHYDRVVDILTEYKATYDPLKKRVDELISRLFQPEEVYDFLHMVETADRASYDPTMRQVLEATVQDRDLKRGMEYIKMLDDEKDRIRKNMRISNTQLGLGMVREIEAARMLSVVAAGKKGKQRLERLQEELRDLSNRALDIEIETTEKYAARTELKPQDPSAVAEFDRQIKDMMKSDKYDEHVLWNFDGEYWNDELGYYWYSISSRCGK